MDDEVVGIALIAALAEQLDEVHLQVLVARFVDEMTQDEIADHLGVSRKTIGKRLDRIRETVIALAGGRMSACVGELRSRSWLRLERAASSGAAPTQSVSAARRAVRSVPRVPRRDHPRCRRAAGARRGGDAEARTVVVGRAARVRSSGARTVARVAARSASATANIASIKGVGEIVTLGLVRERDGAIREDATTFAAGDRWKVVVTCAAGHGTWVDVAVVESGAKTADYPLAPAQIACGNRVVVPGAFELTGKVANRVCVRVAADVAAGARPPRR